MDHEIATAENQKWRKIAASMYSVPDNPGDEHRDDRHNNDQERNHYEEQAKASVHNKFVALDTPDVMGGVKEKRA